MKQCKKCLVDKELTDFTRNKRRADGLEAKCKSCRAELKSIEYKHNKEYYRDKSKERYEANREQEILKRKEHYEANKEQYLLRQKEYYKQNKDTPDFCYAKYKQAARQRNKDWQLTKEQFMSFWKKDCSYCKQTIATIGLDRVDSSIGYVIDNVIPCCGICNWMKLDLTQAEFISHISKIYTANNLHN